MDEISQQPNPVRAMLMDLIFVHEREVVAHARSKRIGLALGLMAILMGVIGFYAGIRGAVLEGERDLAQKELALARARMLEADAAQLVFHRECEDTWDRGKHYQITCNGDDHDGYYWSLR